MFSGGDSLAHVPALVALNFQPRSFTLLKPEKQMQLNVSVSVCVWPFVWCSMRCTVLSLSPFRHTRFDNLVPLSFYRITKVEKKGCGERRRVCGREGERESGRAVETKAIFVRLYNTWMRFVAQSDFDLCKCCSCSKTLLHLVHSYRMSRQNSMKYMKKQNELVWYTQLTHKGN